MQPVVVSAGSGAALSRLHHAFLIAFRINVASWFLNVFLTAVEFLNVCFFCSGMCIATAGFVQKYQIAV